MRAVRFASANPIKVGEAQELIPGLQAVELDLPEVQSTDPAEVVRHKLRGVALLGLDGPVIVEDTGLAVDAWDGLPGALVKWFVDAWGPGLLAARCLAGPDGSDGAEAVSAVGVLDGDRTAVWTGSVRGRIVAPRGDLGGWTSVFEVAGAGRTLAEMSFAERMAVTMRRQPLLRARAWLLDPRPAVRTEKPA